MMEPNAQQYVRTAVIGGANSAHPFRLSLAGIAGGAGDRIYALGDGEVRTFEPDGTFLRGYKIVENATCLAAVTDGRVFVGAPGRVEFYDTDGRHSGGFAAGEKDKPAAVTKIKIFGKEVLVADAAERIIRRYDMKGGQLGLIGTANKTGTFMLPNKWLDFDVDAKGVVHATDTGRHQVSAWKLDGTRLGAFGKFGMQNPADFVAILLVYVMMVLTFNSLVTPFIILFTLPLATIGAFPALYLTGRPIGVSALIGFLMLIGIVVTNAIVLLDLVERLRAEGHSTKDALIEGGRTRVRPILMTAIATILALVPLAAGFNEGSIIAAELGTVVIGGLFSSTFLTLLVIPVVYSLVDGLKIAVARRFGGGGRTSRLPANSRSWARSDAGGQPPPQVSGSARSSRMETHATHAGKMRASGSKNPTLKSMTRPATMPTTTNQRGNAPVRRPMVDDTSMNAPAIFTANP